MLIVKRNYLSIDQIRLGINAYLLICKESKQDHLFLQQGSKVPERERRPFGFFVHGALRLLNMSVSNDLLKLWYEHVKSNLECVKPERIQFEREHREMKEEMPFLLPHEFLYLLCNALSRIETINREHRMNFDIQFGDVYQWEIADGKPMQIMQKLNQMRKLHLLSDDAFDNLEPKELVGKALNSEAEVKRISYIGIKPKKKVAEEKRTRDTNNDSGAMLGTFKFETNMGKIQGIPRQKD